MRSSTDSQKEDEEESKDILIVFASKAAEYFLCMRDPKMVKEIRPLCLFFHSFFAILSIRGGRRLIFIAPGSPQPCDLMETSSEK
ncbi:hypothetical protein CEXT_704181 [Caerostris extrusa]|uniref:Uncharacterized protein n=1 Tax=Caerostris extrusa TaxID=172846 RepID=A0AAV4XGJ7_CAEEX|nr:hypothetical protein CEXT_704181 [Caerostris extrusa]